MSLLTRAETKSIGDYQIEEHVSGLSYPWAIAFISANHYLVTEKTETLRQIVDQRVSDAITGPPEDIYIKGQEGLLDVVLHPNYRTNKWLYLSYSVGNDDSNTLKVIRARLNENSLVDLEAIYSVLPMRDTPVHYGTRLTFMPDNTLLITSGDGFDYREGSQRLDNHIGKIIWVNDDGSLPLDNPFVGES